MIKYQGLYVVAVHIGNREDITFRAIETLKNVDLVITEEYKSGSRILKQLGIEKPLEAMNEHNEKEVTNTLLEKLLMNKMSAALICDAGTPAFADPGNNLIWQCHQNNIKVTPVPGASSLMAALMGSGAVRDGFVYFGFLSANREKRIEELRMVITMPRWDIVFLEAPYRLKQVLKDMRLILGEDRQAVIAYKLTQPEEKFFWGNISELEIMTQELPKGEFVIILRSVKKKKPAHQNNFGKKYRHQEEE